MRKLVLNLCLILLLGFSSETLCVAEELLPTQPYQGEFGESITHTIDFRAIVTPPYHAHKLEVWLPIPTSDSIQEVKSLEISTFPMEVEPQIATESKFGNKFAYFVFDEPKGAQIIQHRFQVTTKSVNWNIEASKVQAIETWPKEFDPYLKSDDAISVTSEIQDVLSSFAPEKKQQYSNLTGAMNWIDKNLVYDHSNSSLQASSEHAIGQRRGHCSDYHGLCSAFGRALNYPTRITYGLAAYPKNSPSHCKLEAFLPPYGWVSYDISETQKLIKKINADDSISQDKKEQLVKATKARLNNGFREDSWILVTRGSDYELAPPASKRVKVVRTIYAEADGEVLPEPDPADITKRTYGWMTSHSYVSSRSFKMPFKDVSSLEN